MTILHQDLSLFELLGILESFVVLYVLLMYYVGYIKFETFEEKKDV